MDPANTEGGDLEHIAPLQADSIPDANQAHYCFSCKTPMQAVYCGNCGQRNDDFRRSILALIKETLGSMFGFESRIWRTWLTLLVNPGKVAREYSDGARTKWSSPVRVYLAMSIILFGYMGCTQTQIFSIDVEPSIKDAASEKPRAQLQPNDIDLNYSARYFITKSEIDERNAGKDFGLIERKFSEGIDLGLGDDDLLEDADAGVVSSDTESEPFFQMKTRDDEGIEFSQQDFSRFAVRAIRNPEILNNSIFVWLPRFMFFMMPLTMLLGAIFIRGKRALLYDHLVHAAYIHAVTFLLVLIGVLIARYFHSAFIAKTILIAVLIYLPLSLKRMFSRGWFKTIFASYSVGFIYLLVISMMMSWAVLADIIQQVGASV